MNNKIEITSDKEKNYEIEMFGKLYLHIHIKRIPIEKENISSKKYKDKILVFETLKNSLNWKDEKFPEDIKDFSKIIQLMKENISNIQLLEDTYYLNLIFDFPKPYKFSISIAFELLNVECFLVKGQTYKRINDEKPFYLSLNNKTFNLKSLKEILEKEKILENYKIESYRYYDEEENGFIKIDEYTNYETPQNKLILELYFNDYIDKITNKLSEFDKNIADKILKIKYNQKSQYYDLIYLYASPIVGSFGAEVNQPINYRIEIKKIINIFNETNKSYNCLFECMNEKTFREVLKQKRTKILHISSHGEINDKDKYILTLEDRAKKQTLNHKELEKLLENNSTKLSDISLVFASTCHSEDLGKLFIKYVKNVIYINKETKISNIAALKFTEIFYKELSKGNSIQIAFNKAKEKIQFDREIILFNQQNNCCEHSKFNLESKENNKDYLSDTPFKSKQKGKLQVNNNCSVFDFDENKNFSVTGRAKNLELIYNTITGKNIHFIIIYGDKEIGKQDFAESACVYLFERKIIKSYEKIELKSPYDFEYIKNKAYYNKNSQEKIITIIKISYILNEEVTIEYLRKILDKKELNVEGTNLYYIILIRTEKNDLIKEAENIKIINLSLDEDYAFKFVRQICSYLHQEDYFNNIIYFL